MRLSDNQYPAALIDGDVLAVCYRAIESALQTVMPADGRFRYVPITPRPSEIQWRAFTGKMPVVGIGWQGWHANKMAGAVFRGPLVFSVAILTAHRQPENLYVGDGKLAGAFGVTAAAIGVLNGMNVPGAGTALVTSASSVELAQFLDEGQAGILLTVQFENVALDMDRIVPQLDDFKMLFSEIVDSSSGEPT
ncbi:hypothetical protein AD945_01780 [Gluconobacter albidus]|uniref:Uncharacterized protein n=1 Tax=Gluconobacter albidus TaxID=318683 RepID=A0A149TMR9_9PROT|nr:hypothetical protein [Gluconobacter albidus]KXV50538.1 hypothetical protein AD945_01780 [Gluconobacter albidus]